MIFSNFAERCDHHHKSVLELVHSFCPFAVNPHSKICYMLSCQNSLHPRDHVLTVLAHLLENRPRGDAPGESPHLCLGM